MKSYREYFELSEADGISGDDVNRHLRESRLGYSEPSADWSRCNEETRCIFEGQEIKNPVTLTGKINLHKPGKFLGLTVINSLHYDGSLQRIYGEV